MSDLIETKEGIVRLSREAGSHEIRKAVIANEPCYVLADSWNSTQDNILFIHGNKKGKKVYKTHQSKVVLKIASNQKKGNFSDFINEDIKAKLNNHK